MPYCSKMSVRYIMPAGPMPCGTPYTLSSNDTDAHDAGV